MLRAIFITGWLMGAGGAFAQEASIELRLDSRVMEVGEAAIAKLVCTNTGVPALPELKVPPGLQLSFSNTTPETMTSAGFVQGRTYQQSTYTYKLNLIAVKEGTYSLGPFTVAADGKTYRTQPVKIVVKAPSPQTKANGDSLVFVEIDAQPRSLYVSESVQATLRIGIRRVENRGRVVPMNLLRDVLDLGSSQVSLFAGSNAQRGEIALKDSAGVMHRYETYTVTKEIRAEKPGELPVGPVVLKANYPTEVRDGVLRYEVIKASRETARAEAIVVQVLAPPDAGRPVDFNGAIGNYAMQVSAVPTRVEQGRPVTLTLRIQGAPLEGVAAPDLSKQPELASRFEYDKSELIGDLDGGAKVFRRAIFPKQPGEQTIPSLSWSFFNTREGRYVTVASQPIQIVVDPPVPGSNPFQLSQEGDAPLEETGLTLLTGGLSPNYDSVDLVLADQSFTFSAPWIGSLVLPPLIYVGVTMTVRRRARLRGDRGYRRRRTAARTARTSLDRALLERETSNRLARLAETVLGYLSDRFDLPPGRVTPADARSTMTAVGVDPATCEEITRFLEACDAARYAPNPAAPMSAAEAAGKIHGWIGRLEKITP